MGRNKYKLPDDLKLKCISLVKGYERRKKLYHERRDEIMHDTAFKDLSCLPAAHSISDVTLAKTERLLKLEQLIETKEMKAVEQAMNEILIESNSEKVIEAIIFSCKSGRKFYFEYWNLPTCRNTFYKYRNRFLYYIAKNIENF